MLAVKEPARQHQIGESKQRKQLRYVFGQPAITGLTMPEQAFDDVEAMLNLGAHAGLGLFQFFGDTTKLVFLERFSQAGPHCRMPHDAHASILGPLFHALVTGVADRDHFSAMMDAGLSFLKDVKARTNVLLFVKFYQVVTGRPVAKRTQLL